MLFYNYIMNIEGSGNEIKQKRDSPHWCFGSSIKSCDKVNIG